MLLLLLIFFGMVVEPCIELEGHHVIVVDVDDFDKVYPDQIYVRVMSYLGK